MKSAQEYLNEMLASSGLLPTDGTLLYRYWQNKETQDMYCYTTVKGVRKGRARYLSWIYRWVKTKKGWKPLNLAGNAKKKDAIARAKRLFDIKA